MTLPPAPTTRVVPGRRLFVTLALGYAALSAGLGSNMALVKLREEISLSSTMVGAHGAMFGICLLFMGVRGPSLVARFGERHSFLAAMGFTGTGAVLYTTAFHVVQSLAGAAAIGFGAATIVIVIPTLVDRMYSNDKDEIFGKLNAWPSGVGIAQGPLLALFMRSSIGWRAPTAVWSCWTFHLPLRLPPEDSLALEAQPPV